MCREGITPSVMTRVRKLLGVALVTHRSKISCTCLGRPISRFSRITSSKKILPLTGRSNTWVRESRSADGDLVSVPSLPVSSRKGVWQPAQPLSEQGVDLLGRQGIADTLESLRIGTGLDAIV